ncbi:hypothetical protein NKG99_20495 [Mesorhizobium sp. M1409]|uniref:hypothetical protein n=1 Tax=Mesorhizobium sp. M1409 TaxID=2957100 RepID=UPI0033380957
MRMLATSRPILQRIENLDAVPSRQDLHEKAAAHAEEVFARKGEAPILWLIAHGLTVWWIETPWQSQYEKDLFTRMMRSVMADYRAHAYAFVSEVVFASIRDEEPEKVAELLALAERDGVASLPARYRDDALVVSSFDRDGDCQLTRYLVTVRKRGPNFLGPRIDEETSGHPEGRLWNLLK